MRPFRGLSALIVMAGAALAAPQAIAAAAANPLEEFKLVYAGYEREYAGRHYAAAIPYAEQALGIARESGAFGEEFVHSLMANLGKMYFLVGRWNDSERIFNQYLAVRGEPGRALDEYLTVLLQAGTAKRQLGRARAALPLFQRAIDFLPRRDKARYQARADTLFQMTLVLLELRQPDSAFEAGEEAWKLYNELHGARDVRTIEAGLILARTEVLLLKNDRAKDHLKECAKSLHQNKALRDWQKSGLHGRIAALYEKMQSTFDAQKHRNMAEAYLRGVGDVELEVKSAVSPEYPRKAVDDDISGAVEVEYTVRRDGSLDDIRIVRSEPPGVFDSAVIKALRKWRYKPPKLSGERVDFPGVRKEILFKVPEKD